jgi:hypothetical protein
MKLEVVQPTKGHSSANKSLYNYFSAIPDNGKLKIYGDCADSEFHAVIVPLERPGWLRDAYELFSAADSSTRQYNESPARGFSMPIPRAFNKRERLELVRRIGEKFLPFRVGIQIDLHNTLARDGLPNPQAHFLFTTHSLASNGTFEKKQNADLNRWMRSNRGADIKQEIATLVNDFARECGYEPQVHIESNEQLGLHEPEPTFPRRVFRDPGKPQHAALLKKLDELRTIRAEIQDMSEQLDFASSTVEEADAVNLAQREVPQTPVAHSGHAEEASERHFSPSTSQADPQIEPSAKPVGNSRPLEEGGRTRVQGASEQDKSDVTTTQNSDQKVEAVKPSTDLETRFTPAAELDLFSNANFGYLPDIPNDTAARASTSNESISRTELVEEDDDPDYEALQASSDDVIEDYDDDPEPALEDMDEERYQEELDDPDTPEPV